MNGDGEFKVYACSHDVPIIKDEGLEFICDYIKKNNVRNVLEIGTAIGYSAIKFAQVSPLVNVVSLEIDIDRYIVAVQSVKDAALSDRIKLFHADALTFDFPDELKETKFDLIFIDAAKAQYIKFFEKYKTCLSENGAIISDNLSFHGMVEDLSLTHNYSTKKLVKKIRRYIEFLKNNTEFTTVFYKDGDGIGVSKRN